MNKIEVVEGLKQLGFTPVDSWGDEGYRLAFGQVELNGVFGLRPPATACEHGRTLQWLVRVGSRGRRDSLFASGDYRVA